MKLAVVISMLLAPATALAAEVAGVAPPGSSDTVASVSWPAALVAASYALRGGVKLDLGVADAMKVYTDAKERQAQAERDFDREMAKDRTTEKHALWSIAAPALLEVLQAFKGTEKA